MERDPLEHETRRAYALNYACSCEGCWAWLGHQQGCTCDVDWDELAERRYE